MSAPTIARLLVFLCLPGLLLAQMTAPATARARPAHDNLMIGTDMMRTVLYLINTKTDQVITLDLSQDPSYPGGMPLHTVVLPDAKTAYLSMMSSDTEPLTILALKINRVDWQSGTAEVPITSVMRVEGPGRAPAMLIPTQTDSSQPITDIWKPRNHQLHGPTIHPNGKWVYFTQWTDNLIRVIDVARDQLAAVDPVSNGTFTRQMHGGYVNPAGNRVLGTGYYFDLNYVTSYGVNPQTGALIPDRVIPLKITPDGKEYAAFTHFFVWLDDRYAVTSSQQTGPSVRQRAGTGHP